MVQSVKPQLMFSIKGLTQRGCKNILLVTLLLSAYPAWFFLPILRPSTTSHLGVVGNDINSSVLEAQALSRMPWPWSKTTFFTFPQSSTFWRIEHIVDIPQKAYYWIGTRFFEPTFVVNTYQLLGLVLTGTAVYVLCRSLDQSKGLSICAGLLAQSLPGIRQLMLTGVAANQNAVLPLLAIAVIVRSYKRVRLQPTLLHLASVVTVAFISSAYSFNYTLVIIVLWALFNLRSFYQKFQLTSHRTKLISLFIIGAVCLLGFVVGQLLLNQTVSESGGPYGIYSKLEVNRDFYTLKGFVTPDVFHLWFPTEFWEVEGYSQQYSGLFIGIGALVAMILSYLKDNDRRYRFVVLVTIVFGWMSLGSIDLGFWKIPAARDFLRFVMIGNRRYAIAGLISQVLLVVLFVYLLAVIQKKIHNLRIGFFLLLVCVCIAVLDLNPVSRRLFYTYSDQYSEIRKILEKEPNSSIYLAPGSESPKDLYVFDYPIFHSRAEVFSYAAQGEAVFAQYLNSQQVKFVLAFVDNDGVPFINGYIQNAVRFKMRLTDNVFVQQSDDIVLSDTDDFGNITRQWTVRLLKVVDDVPNSPPPQSKLAQFVSKPILEVSNPEIDRNDIRIEWATSNDIEFVTEALPSEIVYETAPLLDIFAEILPPPNSTTDSSLVIESSLDSKTITLGKDPVRIKIRARMYDQIKFKSDLLCPLSSDPTLGALAGRPICFGISDFAVLVISG